MITIAVFLYLKTKNIHKPDKQFKNETTSNIQIGKELKINEVPNLLTDKPQEKNEQNSILINHDLTINKIEQTQNECNVSIETIASDYGKEWGPTKDDILSKEENHQLINLMKEYLVCEAIKRDDINKCDISNAVKKYCTDSFIEYKFNEFFIGINKDENDCIRYFEYLKKNPEKDDIGLLKLNTEKQKICSEIKKDLRNICERLFPSNQSELTKCYKIFPKNIFEKCPLENETACSNIYNSIKNENRISCDLFNKKDKELCLTKYDNYRTCEGKLQLLKNKYCEVIKKVKEKKQKEEAKKREEEAKKIEEEIIKKSKKEIEEFKKFKGRKNEEE